VVEKTQRPDPAEYSVDRAKYPPAFAADRMVARLARWLRLLGADVICDPSIDGPSMLRLAREQGRVMLTRDKRLKTAPQAMLLESNNIREQLRQVLARYPFDTHRYAFTRCSRCNHPLTRVARELVSRRVPPFVYARADRFAECEGCGKLYWNATHTERIRQAIESLAAGR
jgi:uncharacterized protein with PIN domain